MSMLQTLVHRLSLPALAVDLGTARLRIALPGKGVILDEPSRFLQERSTGRVIIHSKAIEDFLVEDLRLPNQPVWDTDDIVVRQPVVHGMLADVEAAAIRCREALIQVRHRYWTWRWPAVIVSCPSNIRDFECWELLRALREAGALRVTLLRAAVAAALGAGLLLEPDDVNYIVLIGAGVTELAVLWGDHIFLGMTLPLGGEDLALQVIRFVRHTHLLAISFSAAMDIIQQVPLTGKIEGAQLLEVTGRDVRSGRPGTVSIAPETVQQMLNSAVRIIGRAAQELLEGIPLSFLANIQRQGVLLTGGAQIPGLANYLQEAVELPVITAADPATCVIRGLAFRLMDQGAQPRSMRHFHPTISPSVAAR